MFFFVERIAEASWMFESTHLREWSSRQIDMHNEVTKWCSCSLALHPDSAQRWKFEDTTNPKNHSTTVRKYLPSGATSHPEVRHTGLPSPRSQTNGRLHDRRQRRCDKCHGSSPFTNQREIPIDLFAFLPSTSQTRHVNETAQCNSSRMDDDDDDG